MDKLFLITMDVRIHLNLRKHKKNILILIKQDFKEIMICPNLNLSLCPSLLKKIRNPRKGKKKIKKTNKKIHKVFLKKRMMMIIIKIKAKKMKVKIIQKNIQEGLKVKRKKMKKMKDLLLLVDKKMKNLKKNIKNFQKY